MNKLIIALAAYIIGCFIYLYGTFKALNGYKAALEEYVNFYNAFFEIVDGRKTSYEKIKRDFNNSIMMACIFWPIEIFMEMYYGIKMYFRKKKGS